MTESPINRLVKMANQIALNMAANGTADEVAEQVAQHLRKFWPPSMQQLIIEHLATPDNGLSALAHQALVHLHKLQKSA